MVVVIMVPGIAVLGFLASFYNFEQNTLSSHPQNGGNFTLGVSVAIPQPLLCMCVFK